MQLFLTQSAIGRTLLHLVVFVAADAGVSIWPASVVKLENCFEKF